MIPKEKNVKECRIETKDSPSGLGGHTAFVMSFHYAMHPFEVEMFPYRKQEGIA